MARTGGRGPDHRRRKAWLAEPEQRRWLVTEMLPGYAHDLNPIEMVWGNVKQVDVANLCPDTIDEAQAAAEAGLDRVGGDYELCMAFLAQPAFLYDLALPNYRKAFRQESDDCKGHPGRAAEVGFGQ